jgi:hypothetical protein
MTRNRLHEGSRLFNGEHPNTSPVLPGQVDEVCRVRENEVPADRLLERRPQDRVGVTDRAGRQASVEQFAVERLDVERGNSRHRSRAKPRAHVTAQQPFVVLKALRAQSRLGAELEPAIQVLIQCLLRRVEIPAAISFAEHFVEMSLSVPQSAVDGLAQVVSPLGFGIAAIVYAHQPSAATASDDLPDFSCHTHGGAAHQWHTAQRYSTDLSGVRKKKADRGSDNGPMTLGFVKGTQLSGYTAPGGRF